MAKRKIVHVALTLSVASHVTAAQARREARSRINDLCGYYDRFDDSDVRAHKVAPGGEALHRAGQRNLNAAFAEISRLAVDVLTARRRAENHRKVWKSLAQENTEQRVALAELKADAQRWKDLYHLAAKDRDKVLLQGSELKAALRALLRLDQRCGWHSKEADTARKLLEGAP